jgi:hypothetical protein
MTTNVNATLDERGERYGKFANHASITQRMEMHFVKSMGVEKYAVLQPYQKEALHMIFHKLARIANGDPNYADSWVDIAGYATLVAEELEGNGR